MGSGLIDAGIHGTGPQAFLSKIPLMKSNTVIRLRQAPETLGCPEGPASYSQGTVPTLPKRQV